MQIAADLDEWRLRRAARAGAASTVALWLALLSPSGCATGAGRATPPEPTQAQAATVVAPMSLPYRTEPGWRSADEGADSMGMGLADINGDGFKDIILANGNDLAAKPVVVYYNDGSGRFPEQPSWSSQDLEYNTGLAVGDIDHDGRIDVAVSVGPMPPQDVKLGHVKVYRNRGGALEPSPSYRSGDSYSSVGCALGDMDGDGDLDLAASVAFEEGVAPGPARIYENVDGVLSSLPVWKSARVDHSFGMEFTDIDQDGLLDLAVAMPGVPIFRAVLRDRGVISLSREPGWTASQAIRYPMFLDAGRLGTSTGLVVSYSDYGASIGRSGGARAPGVSAAPAAGAGAGAAAAGGDTAGAGTRAASASSTRFEAYAPQLDTYSTELDIVVSNCDTSSNIFENAMQCSLIQGQTVIRGVVSNVVTGENSRMDVQFNVGNAPPGWFGVQARTQKAESTLPRAFEVERGRVR